MLSKRDAAVIHERLTESADLLETARQFHPLLEMAIELCDQPADPNQAIARVAVLLKSYRTIADMVLSEGLQSHAIALDQLERMRLWYVSTGS